VQEGACKSVCVGGKTEKRRDGECECQNVRVSGVKKKRERERETEKICLSVIK